MRHGTKLATTLALALTICSGIAAVGATTGLLAAGPESSPGTARLIDEERADGREEAPLPTGSPADPSAAEQADQQADRAAPGSVAGKPVGNTSGSAPIAAPLPATPAYGGTSVVAADDSAEPAPPPTTTPTTPAVTPPVPTLDCHGSDDGMSEAEKQAREHACEGTHDDD